MNICPPAWVSSPLLFAITADAEELIQGNWMLPESSYQRFLKMFVVSGELFIVSLLPTTQGQTREQSWQWHWSMTVISSILTAPMRMIYPHQNSFKHSESAQPTPVTVRPPPPPGTPPPLSIFHNFSSIISSAKIVFHIEGLAISLSHFRWWYLGQSGIFLPPSLSMFFLGDETLLTSRSTLLQSVSQSVSLCLWTPSGRSILYYPVGPSGLSETLSG